MIQILPPLGLHSKVFFSCSPKEEFRNVPSSIDPPKASPLRGESPRAGRRRRKSRPTSSPVKTEGGSVRLQKALASAGLGSRRQCEAFILTGRVEIDRQVVRELGTRVDPRRQEIRFDGKVLDGKAMDGGKRVYYLVNKPPGVVSTNRDPSGRPRVIDLLPPGKELLFTVGRLDRSSEGLILVTNDGELANRLAHPRFGVHKTYHALVAGIPDGPTLEKLRQGAHLAEGFARPVSARVKKTLKQSTLLEIVLAEGLNREIRRLLARVGHKVLRLKRVALGGVKLADMKSGEFRRLRPDELRLLKRPLGSDSRSDKARKSAHPRMEETGPVETSGPAIDPTALQEKVPGGASKSRRAGKPAGRSNRPRGKFDGGQSKSRRPGKPAGRSNRPRGKFDDALKNRPGRAP